MFGYIIIKRKRLRQIIKKIAEYELQKGYELGKKQAFDSIGVIYNSLGLRMKRNPIIEALTELPNVEDGLAEAEEIIKKAKGDK